MPIREADIGMHPKSTNSPTPISIQKLDSNQVAADPEKLKFIEVGQEIVDLLNSCYD